MRYAVRTPLSNQLLIEYKTDISDAKNLLWKNQKGIIHIEERTNEGWEQTGTITLASLRAEISKRRKVA